MKKRIVEWESFTLWRVGQEKRGSELLGKDLGLLWSRCGKRVSRSRPEKAKRSFLIWLVLLDTMFVGPCSSYARAVEACTILK